ncbi:MAG: hypothetical protein ICV64_04715 [Thermoleophilia bacterium]|nr:hypothetical protein [Thermoleophilia bacterium]
MARAEAPGAVRADPASPYPDWVLTVPKTGGPPSTHARDDAGEAPPIARLGSSTGVFDGVLFNGDELARRLDARLVSGADVVVRAYEAWGERFLGELAGVFTTAVYDESRALLIAARDRLGSYPLFYADTGRELLLSTSVDAILADGRVPAEVNRAAIADHLAHRWPDPGETYYAAIRRVPPGHVLVVERGREQVRRYWSPVAADGEVAWVGEDEVDQFEELLEAAIRRFVALGDIGIFLSGGLDSVSVAALAARVARDADRPAPLALSLGFSHHEADEQALQRRVAADLELPQVMIPLEEASGENGLMASALELNSTWPAPVVNMWLPAYHHLALEGKERERRVILTGHGGDEWLSVTPYYAADLIIAGDVRRLYRLWNNHRRSYPIPPWTILRNILWRFGTRPLLGALADRAAPSAARALRLGRAATGIADWIAPDPALRRQLDARAASSVRPRPRVGQIYLDEMNQALDHALVAMELEEAFESGRRLGLRFGHPFWDADLLAFLYRTPPDLLNRGGKAKGLVRSMLAKRFPDLGFERHRKIIGTPVVREINVREGAVAWRRMGGTKALAELGIVDGAKAGRLVEGILGRPGSPEENVHSYRVWDILALEAWVRARVKTS